MLSGIPALHSSFIQQSTKFSAYIIVIGNKILNKEPYIIIIANSVQPTWVKRNPHLVFRKTTDKTCSLCFFLAQYRADKNALVLDTQTPKVQRVVCSEGCPQDCHAHLPSWFPSPGSCYQRPLTLAMSEWYWRGSLPLAPPSRNEARMLDGSNSFLRFLFSSGEAKHTHRNLPSETHLNLLTQSKCKASV